MAYADAIPIDLLKTEQERITTQRCQAEKEAAGAQTRSEDVTATYEQARALMERGAEAYRLGGPDTRRLLTRAFLTQIDVNVDDEAATLASPWLEIRDAATRLRQVTPRTTTPSRRRSTASVRGVSMTNPGPHFEDRGSTMNPLVELQGLEPWTFCMPCRRSSQLSYSP